MAEMKMTQEEIEKTFSAAGAKAGLEAANKALAEGKTAQDAEIAKIKAEFEAFKKQNTRESEWEALMNNAEIGKNGVPQIDPMKILGQYAVAGAAVLAETKEMRMIDPEAAYKKAQKIFPNEKATLALMQKDLSAGVPSAGGYGIPLILSPDVIRVLYARTILDRVGATKVPMPNGNFRMARMDYSSSVGWVGELPSTGPTQPTLGDIALTAKKLYALVPISNSLLRYNAVGMDSWVSMDLATRARIELDKASLYGAGTLYTPQGLSGQGVQTSGTTGTAVTIKTPVDMVALLEQANVPMLNPYWVLSPIAESYIKDLAFASGPFAWAPEMNSTSHSLNGVPYTTSSTVSKATDNSYSDMWIGDWSEFVWGVSYDLSLEISREGSYVANGSTYSAFQRDETLVRLITEHDFGVKHPVSFVQGTYAKPA
jgi:HK97 family phage major capsid protein